MRKGIWLLLSIIAALSAQSQQNQKTADNWYKLIPTKTIGIKSKFSGREYKIHISYSTDSLTAGKRYPVLYYTDAWEITQMATMFAKALVAYGEARPFILVGISFDASEESFLKLRAEDFKPDVKTDAVNGAALFLSFIKDQLIPYVEQNLPADPNDRGYYGYSLGGTFGAWILKKEPALFQRLALGSSAGSLDLLLQDEIFRKNIRKANNLRLFTSFGSEEKNFAGPNQELQQLITSNPQIQSEHLVFDEDTHATAWPMALMRGLKFLYKQ